MSPVDSRLSKPLHRIVRRRKPALDNRHGALLLEVMISMLLMGSVFCMVAPVLKQVADQRRAGEQRQRAQLEVADILERLSARNWDALDGDDVSDLPLSAACRAALREPTLAISVTKIESEPDGRRVTVELRWKNSAGDFLSPARLTAWNYRRGISK